MRTMNELFILVHEALDCASIREREFQCLQTRLEEKGRSHQALEILQGNQAVEISKLKNEVKKSAGRAEGL